MGSKTYRLVYLPLFLQDLEEVASCIRDVLKNGEAARNLVNEVEAAIRKRLNNPLSFEPYHSQKKREHTYYRIYVKNYVVYYVVIEDVMEVRRLLYKAMDTDKHLK